MKQKTTNSPKSAEGIDNHDEKISKLLKFFISIFVILSILLVLWIKSIRTEMSSMVKENKQIISEFSTDYTQKIDGELKSIADSDQELRGFFDKKTQEILNGIDPFRVEMTKIMARDSGSPGNSATVNSHHVAAGSRALELGITAQDSNEIEKAALYFVNGINHDPSNMELIEALASAAKASGISYLRTRSIGILELATMQVTPDQMNRVLFLIDELRELSEPVELTNLSVGQLSEKWTSIGKEFNPERIWNNAERVNDGLAEIEYFISDCEIFLDENNSAVMKKQTKELEDSLTLVLVNLSAYSYTNSCVEQMEAISEMALVSNPEKEEQYKSLLISANSSLPQIWGNTPKLPETMRKKIEAFPLRISRSLLAFQKKTSQENYDSIKNSLIKAKEFKSGEKRISTRINRIKDSIQEAKFGMQKISYQPFAKEILVEINNSSKKIVDLDIDRRTKYQAWVIDICKKFWIWHGKEILFDDEDALKFFEDLGIAKIDERLLVPEVSSLLGRVVQEIVKEEEKKQGHKIQRYMASALKRSLNFY